MSVGELESVLKIRERCLLYSALLGAGSLALDLIGPIPFIFMVPVMVASWYGGLGRGLIFALGLPVARLGIGLFWEDPLFSKATVQFFNAWVRCGSLACLAFLMSRLARRQQQLSEEVRVLRGILPICAFCKKIRGPDGRWQTLENYISTHSEAQFSHSFCSDCAQKHYGEYYPADRAEKR